MDNTLGYSPSKKQETVFGKDSKVARQFLRHVLHRLGKKVPEELSINSWELYELIEKSIELMRVEISRQRKVIKGLVSLDADRRQQTLRAIGDFYDK